MASPGKPKLTDNYINMSESGECRAATRHIIQNKDIRSLRKFGGVSMVAATFNSDIEAGLLQTCASSLKQVDAPSFTSFLLEELKSAILLPLFFSAVICFGAGFLMKNPDYGWVEGADILVNLFILLLLPSIQKYYTARNNAKKMKLQKVGVIRDAKYQEIVISEVLEGDLVVLNKGTVVPGDGLVVYGDELQVDDTLNSLIDCNDDPFLFSGTTIVSGEGRMIVVAIGDKTSLGETTPLVNPIEEKALFESQLDDLSKIKEYVLMFIYIGIALVLSFQILYTRNHRKNEESNSQHGPNLHNKVASEFIEAMFKKILSKSRGKIILFIYSLTLVDMGLQGILPPTITASLIWWNRNLLKKYQIHAKNLYVSGTMALATILVIDVSRGLLVDQCLIKAVKALLIDQKTRVSVILVSRDEEELVTAIADELGIRASNPKDLVVNGAEFEQERTTQDNASFVRIMYKSQPKHTLLLVKALREKGHVVAYLGGLSALDSHSLKESNVGISKEHCSSALARESSDVVMQTAGCKGSLLPLLTSGKFVYSNVASFVEILLATSICILFMAFVLKPFHLIWVTLVIHMIGFPMILMELPRKTTVCLEKKFICLNIACKVFCQLLLLLLSFGFILKQTVDWNEVIREAMAFNILTMFQVFYLLQTMGILNVEVLTGTAAQNYGFLAGAIGMTVICHFILLTYCADQNLGFVQWAFCFLLVLLLWLLDWTVKFVVDCFRPKSISTLV